MTTTRLTAGRTASRWSKTTLVADGCFLLTMGLLTAIFANQSHADGSGPLGETLLRQPYVVGFVEAALLIAVIGAGLLGVGLFSGGRFTVGLFAGGLFAGGLVTPTRPWHIFAILAHLTLASIDLSYLDTMASLDLAAENLAALVAMHALFTTAHVICLVSRRRARATLAPAGNDRQQAAPGVFR
ncbi:MAG: hypothetical protein ACRDP8_17935 [Actinopolymorphaceae bacterium]